jgi:hypothetical protein
MGFFAETRHRKLMTNLFGATAPKIIAEMAKEPKAIQCTPEPR